MTSLFALHTSNSTRRISIVLTSDIKGTVYTDAIVSLSQSSARAAFIAEEVANQTNSRLRDGGKEAINHAPLQAPG